MLRLRQYRPQLVYRDYVTIALAVVSSGAINNMAPPYCVACV